MNLLLAILVAVLAGFLVKVILSLFDVREDHANAVGVIVAVIVFLGSVGAV